MHTFVGAHGTVFNFNSDGSGHVIVTKEVDVELSVPCDDLMEFVAHLIRQQRIARLEQEDWRDVLDMAD